MSNPGQPIDPMQQMAAAGMAPPDPMEAVAMGKVLPNAPPLPKQPAPESTRVLPVIIRNMANGATFNLADPIAAAGDATIPLDMGSSVAPTWAARFHENLAAHRKYTGEGQQAHPYVALGSSIAGGMMNPVTRSLATPKTLSEALIQGANIGGAYGAGGAIGTTDNLLDAGKQIAFGALTGGVTSAGGYGLGKLLAGATRSPNAQLLADEGVPLTMGQSLGGTAKTLEDASTHIPMIGNAIKGRQVDAIEGFNRAAYNRVLEPLGLEYSPNAEVGNAGIRHVSNLISDAYDKAFDGATIKQTPQFGNDVSQAVQEATATLPKERVDLITKNINNRLISKFDANGDLPTEDLIRAKNWFAEQSRAGPNASQDERSVASAYGTIVDAIKDAIGVADPDKGALLQAADKAHMLNVKLQQAAGQNAASGRGGIFTPAQLGMALRSTEQSTRRMNFAKGLSPMQDLAQAGQDVLPSTVPDSGTALRGLLELGAGGLVTHSIAPEAAVPALGAIGVGTAAYSRPGQALARALLYGGGAGRKAMAAVPSKLAPGLTAALLAGGAGANGGIP